MAIMVYNIAHITGTLYRMCASAVRVHDVVVTCMAH